MALLDCIFVLLQYNSSFLFGFVLLITFDEANPHHCQMLLV